MTTTTTQIETLKNGKRLAVISPMGEGCFSVWVGYAANDGGEDHPALWFDGFSTCGKTFASHKNAHKAAQKFLNHK